MLLNYNDTLDAVFTLAHEMGHSMHTLLSHETQPFIYADYTIFVAEVPSTLSEALLLDYARRAKHARERIVLLQHAIDGIVGTFYTQVLFADFELEAHRLVERGEPMTADVLSERYPALLQDYYGDALAPDDPLAVTWARIPHFFQAPYSSTSTRRATRRRAKLSRDDGAPTGAARSRPWSATSRLSRPQAATTR